MLNLTHFYRCLIKLIYKDVKYKKILKDDRTRQRGTIIAFPSFAYHRVTKVTRGERLSIVIWYKGDVWK